MYVASSGAPRRVKVTSNDLRVQRAMSSSSTAPPRSTGKRRMTPTAVSAQAEAKVADAGKASTTDPLLLRTARGEVRTRDIVATFNEVLTTCHVSCPVYSVRTHFPRVNNEVLYCRWIIVGCLADGCAGC